MVKAVKQIKGKPIKKAWYSIKATAAFDSSFLGETYVAEPSLLVGRKLTLNLANLTGDIKQQGISLKFVISSINDSVGIADVIGYEASSSQLRRLVRRGVERMDDSIKCETSDGRALIIKPFAVTRTSTSKHKLSQMRAYLRDAIINEVKKYTFDELVKMIISNKLQTLLKSGVKKIYPLKALEIRKLLIVGAPKVAPIEDKPSKVKQKTKTPKKDSNSEKTAEPTEETTEEKSVEETKSIKKSDNPIKEAEKPVKAVAEPEKAANEPVKEENKPTKQDA